MTTTTARPKSEAAIARENKRKRDKAIYTALRVATHLGAILPLLWLYYQWYTYALINETREITLFTGSGGLIFLILSLLITPLKTLTAVNTLTPLRKPLGLYAFLYVCVHLGMFILGDLGLINAGRFDVDWSSIQAQVLEKRFVLVGLASFLIMLPLAITSNTYSIKRLKKRWKQLHKWVYLSAVLAIVHYLWLVKQDYTEPILYGAAVALLLSMRIPKVRKWVVAKRRALIGA